MEATWQGSIVGLQDLCGGKGGTAIDGRDIFFSAPQKKKKPRIRFVNNFIEAFFFLYQMPNFLRVFKKPIPSLT